MTFDTPNGEVAVYKNPGHSEFMGIPRASKCGALRGQLIYKGDLFVWDATKGLHDDVERHVGGERVAMSDHLLVVDLNGRHETTKEMTDDYARNPNVMRAFGGLPEVGNYQAHPEFDL